jgi:hypothetical protein
MNWTVFSLSGCREPAGKPASLNAVWTIRLIRKISFARWLVALMFRLAGVKFWRWTGYGRISGWDQQSFNIKMKHILETLPDKAQTAEVHFLNFLTQFFHEHAFYSLMGIMFLLIFILIYFLVVASRHRGEYGSGESGVRAGVVFRIGQSPSRESDTFNPFPPSSGHNDDSYD